MIRATACAAVTLALAACDENMVQQPRDDAYEETPLFADGKVMQAPPAGTVARDAAERAAAVQRPPMSLALIERGRERYEIYCSMCHGYDGAGGGVVPSRGYPRPPSYDEARLRAAPTAHFYDVITHGYGVMYAYADRVAPADRWAIAAYIRALQASRPPPAARASSEAGHER